MTRNKIYKMLGSTLAAVIIIGIFEATFQTFINDMFPFIVATFGIMAIVEMAITIKFLIKESKEDKTHERNN